MRQLKNKYNQEAVQKKVLGRRISQAVERFNPDAIDGDEDGKVQDGTQFERPEKLKNRTKRRAQRLSGAMGEEGIGKAPEKKKKIVAAGLLSGKMGSDNPHTGKTIDSRFRFTQAGDEGKVLVAGTYGEVPVEVEYEPGAYSGWVDAYDSWVTWPGNYAMSVLSEILVGRNAVPPAAGYNGDGGDSHFHDMIGTGKAGINAEKGRFADAIKNTFVALAHIASGKEKNRNKLYRGLHSVDRQSPLMTAKPGEELVLGLSAFTPSMESAYGYATDRRDATSQRGQFEDVIIELEPGAKVGLAAGEQYLFQYLENGEWKVGITEAVTQGRFVVRDIKTVLHETPDGMRPIRHIKIAQKSTYDPEKNEFIPNFEEILDGDFEWPQLAGLPAFKTIEEAESNTDKARSAIQRIRSHIEDNLIVPKSMDDYMQAIIRNRTVYTPGAVKRLADVISGRRDRPIKPDGNPMSDSEYLALATQQELRDAAEVAEDRASTKVRPVMDKPILDRVQDLTEGFYLMNPIMLRLLEMYAPPTITVPKVYRHMDEKTREVKVYPVEEARARGLLTDLAANNSAYNSIYLYPLSNRFEFIKRKSKDENVSEVLTRYFDSMNSNLFSVISMDELVDITRGRAGTIDFVAFSAAMSVAKDNKTRPWALGTMTPYLALAHEMSHGLVAQARYQIENSLAEAEANLAELSKEAKENLVIRARLIDIMNETTWSSPTVMSIFSLFGEDMSAYSPTLYADSAPAEWLAETLTAWLSPYEQVRELVPSVVDALFGFVFPEMLEVR